MKWNISNTARYTLKDCPGFDIDVIMDALGKGNCFTRRIFARTSGGIVNNNECVRSRSGVDSRWRQVLSLMGSFFIREALMLVKCSEADYR